MSCRFTEFMSVVTAAATHGNHSHKSDGFFELITEVYTHHSHPSHSSPLPAAPPHHALCRPTTAPPRRPLPAPLQPCTHCATREYSTAQHTKAQHSTAQLSTTWHITAQHSTLHRTGSHRTAAIPGPAPQAEAGFFLLLGATAAPAGQAEAVAAEAD